MAAARHFLRENDAVAGIRTDLSQPRGSEQTLVPFSNNPPGVVPALDVFELYRKDRGLDTVQTGVPADLVVTVPASHAVLSKGADAFGQRFRVGGDHAGVAGSAQVLGGIEAEGGNLAQPARLNSFPFSVPGL